MATDTPCWQQSAVLERMLYSTSLGRGGPFTPVDPRIKSSDLHGSGVDPLIVLPSQPLYDALTVRCAAAINCDGTRSALSGCTSRRTIPVGSRSRKVTGTQSGRQRGRQGVLPVGVPALPPRPELRRYRPGRQFPSLLCAPETPDFGGT